MRTNVCWATFRSITLNVSVMVKISSFRVEVPKSRASPKKNLTFETHSVKVMCFHWSKRLPWSKLKCVVAKKYLQMRPNTADQKQMWWESYCRQCSQHALKSISSHMKPLSTYLNVAACLIFGLSIFTT